MVSIIERLNDLYFPQGNEYGEFYEPYYKATAQDVAGYGSTPQAAQEDCLHKLREIKKGHDIQNCCCEYDKYVRAYTNQGTPKSLYNGKY